MNCEALRRSLLAAASQNRPYEFLHAALPYVEQVPDDLPIRLMAVKLFAELGLFGPAVELADDGLDVRAQAPDLAPMLETLGKQPSGRVDWETFSGTFERNLASACERFDACRGAEGQLRESWRDLELYRCRDGNLLLSRRVGSGPRRWLPSVIDWVTMIRECKVLRPDPRGLCRPYLIEGVGLGHALRTVYDNTSKMFLTYTPRLHLFEPNVAQLAVWLHLDDHRDLLQDERFHLWLGEEGVEAFIEFHRARPTQSAPVNVIRQPGWGPAAKARGADALQRLAAEAAERRDRSRQAIRDALAGRDSPAHYADRFEHRAERPIRILGITSRFTTFLQYSMRDIQQTATELGHEFRLLIEGDDHTPSLPPEYVTQQIEEVMPDLILILDHNRKEYGDHYDFPIPFCNWIQDDLPNLFGPGCGSGLHAYDIVVGTIGSLRAGASGYPRAQWQNFPTPVRLRTFSNEPVPESDRRAHECDISFASHLNLTRDALLRDTLAQVRQPEIRRLLEAQYELLGPQIAAGDVPASVPQTVARIQRLANELGFQIDYADADRIRQIFTDRLINSHFREQVLVWASDMGLDLNIYGHGWDKHPTLARHARGPAKHGYQLRCIFQASRINLQAVPGGAIHQRLIEGLFSGGFFAIRRTANDAIGPLHESILRRCLAMDIQTEDELWNTSDEALARDVQALNDALYAPSRLYDGFVSDLRVGEERGFSLQAGQLIPHYDDVNFGTRQEFERIVGRFLNDGASRRAIADAQREVVVKFFSYRGVLDRILDFAQRRFTNMAAVQPCLATQG